MTDLHIFSAVLKFGEMFTEIPTMHPTKLAHGVSQWIVCRSVDIEGGT